MLCSAFYGESGGPARPSGRIAGPLNPNAVALSSRSDESVSPVTAWPPFSARRLSGGAVKFAFMISRLGALCCGVFVVLAAPETAWAQGGTNGNRLVYLDESDPFYPGLDFPRLATPQWVGEKGVEAVVILAIDDMRDPAKYEEFLRPILDRLKAVDGRAPLSIFCNQLDPQQPQLQSWLREGLSLEVHTLSHPCPLLANSNFVAAAATYHDCVDLLNRVPGNRPAAFRMPCCDSMNSPSPRFYDEIFNRVSAGGRFLTIDSSVMNLTTSNDRSLPRELVLDGEGRERFRAYFPAETNQVTRLSLKGFATTIEDYPYPYVIGGLCWEFPPMVPSDWEANNARGPNQDGTVADWKAALDATVLKQGVFTFIFHPHGWIRPAQLVEFIDYADRRYGRKVRFLNLREAQDRLDRNLLAGEPLRAADGGDNGVRLLDLNRDGWMDVVIGNGRARKTRLWQPGAGQWAESEFPVALTSGGGAGNRRDSGARFGVVKEDGNASLIVREEGTAGAWHFDGSRWVEDKALLAGLEIDGRPVLTAEGGRDQGVRFRDVDHDGRCELIVSNPRQNAVFGWSSEGPAWRALPFALPRGLALVDADGRDNGLRFVDLNQDGFEDLLFSNAGQFALHLFIATPKSWLGWDRGWTFQVTAGKRGEPGGLPMIVRDGPYRNNGAWFHARQMCVQNEETAHLPDKVERYSFSDLLTIAEPPAKSPAESLAAMRVRPGFKAELVASEPLVVDPVAFDWGPDGKFWVVEMRDYPLGMDGHGKAGGVIKYLEDTDGDGRYDKATVFLDGVNFPNGIMAWRKGVLVSAAPEIFYAEDTDGDGKANVRKPILVGFNEGNQQHRVNGFEYGLDNWVYAANGGSGGNIRSVPTGKTANLRGHDLRFKPDTGDFELVEGQTQFGRRRDDWGHWFGNENPTWLWHYWLPESYATRNPDVAVPPMRRVLANYPNATRVFPLSRPQQRFNWPEAANNLTSANSPTPYRDRLFGADYETSVFVSEPAQNVVHREILEPDGVSFTSHRAKDEADREFLASTDNWFRPTMLRTGPDGALYIADIYRRVIEHPEYFPEELKSRPDLRAGEDMGRIYRVYPEGATLRPVPRLDGLPVTNLIERLASTNGWERDLAQRMLIWRPDPPPQTELLRVGANHGDPRVRLQVLSTLAGLGDFSTTLAFYGLGDRNPAVKAFALRAAEPLLKKLTQSAPDRSLAVAVLQQAKATNAAVRYQLALTLGEWDDPRAGQALAQVALTDRDDPRIQAAVLSSATRHAAAILDGLLADSRREIPPDLLAYLLGRVLGSGDAAAAARALERLGTPAGGGFAAWQVLAAAAFLDGQERLGHGLDRLRQEAAPDLKPALEKLQALVDFARKTAGAPASGEGDRLAAIRLLGRTSDSAAEDAGRLAGLLRPQSAAAVQQAALDRLEQLDRPQVARALLDGWRTYGPSLRTEVLNALLSRPAWTRDLLAAIQSGAIDAAEIDPTHRQRLARHSEAGIRGMAEKLFAVRNADRQKLVEDYGAVNRLEGNPGRGADLFRQNCAPCHRLKGEGNNVGPDLGTVSDKPVGTLLVAILDPNQAFETKYINYTVTTRDGRDLSGIIAAETPNGITLRNAGGKDEVILRGEVQEMTSSRLSLMPEGFENVLKPQDMADLIAWIRRR